MLQQSKMSKKLITPFSNYFQILCRTVTMKAANLTVLKPSCFNNINTGAFNMNRYCTNHDSEIIAKTILSEDKISMAEEDKKLIQNWIEMLKYRGTIVPNSISDEQYLKLFKAKTGSQKFNYLKYLVLKEKLIAKYKLSREQQRSFKAEYQKERMCRSQGHIEYGLWKNAMFAKINKQQVDDLYHHRLASIMIHGQPLVIDLGFEHHMSYKQLISYATQLKRAVLYNKTNNEPFNLTFCNTNFESMGFQNFVKLEPKSIRSTFPMNITSQSYLDMFPKDKIVYLSPDAKDVMKSFDHNAIYIIGGIHDYGNEKPFSLAKAKKERIKIQKLPLDRYHGVRRSLPLNVMVAILLDVRKDGDWKKAFRNHQENVSRRR